MPRSPSQPLVQVTALQKQYGGPHPLRIREIVVSAGEALVLQGLDAAAAETLVNLLTGASVPDEGRVHIEGRDTREIATDTDWLASLDRLGLVTLRAVLIGVLPVEQNMALPMTLSIDPMADETRSAVERLADEVGLARTRLRVQAHALSPAELIRVHLARALALQPAVLILEHPTSGLDIEVERREFGRLVADVATRRALAWVAISNDEAFVRGTGRASMRLDASGALKGTAWWRRLFSRGQM